MKRNVLKVVGLGFVMAAAALAGGVTVAPAPEIDPTSIAVPLALVSGAVLIVRSRIRH
jgi:hypothetical protein